jgi:hypothetical protein
MIRKLIQKLFGGGQRKPAHTQRPKPRTSTDISIESIPIVDTEWLRLPKIPSEALLRIPRTVRGTEDYAVDLGEFTVRAEIGLKIDADFLGTM